MLMEQDRGSLADIRQALADVIELVTSRVYPYVPDDVAEIPCVVVGPLSLTRNAAVGGWSVVVPVVVVGRRINSWDAQRELEELAWNVIGALEQTQIPGAPGARPTFASPETQDIAGEDYPVYEISVAAEAVYC